MNIIRFIKLKTINDEFNNLLNFDKYFLNTFNDLNGTQLIYPSSNGVVGWKFHLKFDTKSDKQIIYQYHIDTGTFLLSMDKFKEFKLKFNCDLRFIEHRIKYVINVVLKLKCNDVYVISNGWLNGFS